MPDSPDRQVPPPPPAGGAAPIPDLSSHTGQAPRRGGEQGTPTPRLTPPARGATREDAPTPPAPPAPPGPSPAESLRTPATRRAPGRRQPLGHSAMRRDESARPSPRERLQRLAQAQRAEQARIDQPTAGQTNPIRRAGVPPQPTPRRDDGQPAPLIARQPQRPRSQTVSTRGERVIPARGESAAPVVPGPPSRTSVPAAAGRIPEPPARATGPAPSRRRPVNRILEALDAKLAAEQAEQAKEKTAERVRSEALRRVRPTLSSRRPTPPKAPTPSVTSSVPIAPRVPQPSRGMRGSVAGASGDTSRALASDDVMPLPDPSVPPVPVIPMKPVDPQPSEVTGLSDNPPVTEVSEPSADPLAASYERLVKAAKRQAALEAALAPDLTSPGAPSADMTSPDTAHLDAGSAGQLDRTGEVDSADTQGPDAPHSDDATTEAPEPGSAAGVMIAAPVVPMEPTPEDIHEEFEQAKRDADRFFGPDDFAPNGDATDTSVAEGVGDDAAVHVTAVREDDLPIDDGTEASSMTDDARDATVIIPEETTPPTGIPLLAPDIEDAEIVADAPLPQAGDVIGTIIATDLDLITAPEAVEVVEPDTIEVDEPVLTGMPVTDEAIDAALASAPARVVDEPEEAAPLASEPAAEDTPPQSRGFRALTAVLILIIFALVCIAAYRMMMRPGNGMVEPTPTPIVPTAQSDQPGASASPARSPKASEVATPVPALPPREPLPSDAAIPPALPGQSITPEVMGGAGNVEIGQHTIALSQINDVNLPGLIDKPVAGENVQVQSILGDGAYVWMGSDQDNRILAVIPEPFREALKDLQAGDRVDFIGTLGAADVPEILAPEQGRDRLIRQGAAIEVRDITVRQ